MADFLLSPYKQFINGQVEPFKHKKKLAKRVFALSDRPAAVAHVSGVFFFFFYVGRRLV